MAGWTNKGKEAALDVWLRGTAAETNTYLALLTDATGPTASSNTMSDVTEVTAGNGYTSGGRLLTPGATDFDTLTEDDANSRGLIQLKDIAWTASGGNLPNSSNGARYAVLTDDNATVSAREIYCYWDLSSARTVSDTQTLTLQDCEIRINES